MFGKILAISVFITVAYCQDHHYHTYSLETVVKHETPKKVEIHHHEPVHKAAVQTHEIHVAPIHHSAAVSSQSVVHQDSHGHVHHEAPKHYFVPAHEPAPVHEIAIEPSVKKVYVPFVPVKHVPVQHIHVQPIVQQVSHHEHKESHHEESNHKESGHKESHHKHTYVDYYAHPKYEFEYKVEDPHTGDKKYQHEHRDGDVVKGEYGLHEADGSIRTVKYSSDKKTGFNAEVYHKGHSTHVHQYHHHH